MNGFEEYIDNLTYDDYNRMLEEILKLNLNLELIVPIHEDNEEYLKIGNNKDTLPLFTKQNEFQEYIDKHNFKNIKAKTITISQITPDDEILNGIVNPLTENLELDITTIHVVDGFTKITGLISHVESEFSDIVFEKLSDDINLDEQILNIKLQNEKLDEKFIQEYSDLMILSIFITPIHQHSQNEYEFFRNEDDTIPIFTNKENYNIWIENNNITDDYEAYVISMDQYLEYVYVDDIETIINPGVDDVILDENLYELILSFEEEEEPHEFQIEEISNDEIVKKDDFKPTHGYDVKVRLNNFKPITWRDLIIPAGITFEELHLIIQILMDLGNCHLYMFKSKSCIERIVDFDFIDDWDDIIDSKTTIIDKYFDNNKKITYIYDFGDNWEFIIEIKKKVEINSYYPKLKRFKGDYGPVEDCGGLWRLDKLIDLKTGKIPISEADEWEEDALEYMEKFDLEDVQNLLEYYMDEEFRS